VLLCFGLDGMDLMLEAHFGANAIAGLALWTLIETVVVCFIAAIVTSGKRVDKEIEEIGLDESTHGEKSFCL